MRSGFDSNSERQLDELFAAYRAACPEPEPSPDFMPRLWARIDDRQRGQALFAWRRCAQAFIGLAAVVSLFLIVLQVVPRQNAVEVQTSYLDQLSEDDRRAETFIVPVALSSTTTRADESTSSGAHK